MKTKVVVYLTLAAILALLGIFGGIKIHEAMVRRADAKARVLLVQYFKIADKQQIGAAEKANLTTILAQLEELDGRCSKELGELLHTRLIDGAFLVGDYEKAVRLITDVSDKPDTWKAGVAAKVRAHAALEKGDKREAVIQFEIFCSAIEADPEYKGDMDPQTCVEWSKEGLLARNYLRIADLYRELGDAAKAAAFREKAKPLARKALEAAVDELTRKALEAAFTDLLK